MVDWSDHENFEMGAIERHPCPHCGSFKTPTLADIKGKQKWLVCASCEGWAIDEEWGLSVDENGYFGQPLEEFYAQLEDQGQVAFNCTDCGAHNFEVEDDFICPECGSPDIEAIDS